MPRVGVIIPTYNCAQYLDCAIASVMAQTMADFELIVVDDGSTDNAQAIAAAYSGDSRVRYVRQGNRGLPGARNTGVRLSSSAYLAFLDADDTLAPSALETLSTTLDRNAGRSWCVTDILRVTGPVREAVRSIMPQEEAFYAILRDDFIRRGMFFRREALLAMGLYDETIRVREDWDLNIRMIHAGLEFAYVPEPLYEYAMRQGSITTANPARMFAFTEQLLRKHHKRLADAGDRRAAAIYAELMWDLGRRYFHSTGSLARTASCIGESLRYERDLGRLLHPVVHGLQALRRRAAVRS